MTTPPQPGTNCTTRLEPNEHPGRTGQGGLQRGERAVAHHLQHGPRVSGVGSGVVHGHVAPLLHLQPAMNNANRDVRGFGWEIAHEVVSRRPPISLDTIVARTHMYTYAVEVWDLSIVQGPFSVAPRQT
jgi:hypothetical protein